MGLSFINGNQAIAWGAMHAGCRFFAGYPITPATSIFTSLLDLLPPAGGICMQAEDEIASIGYCLGASMAGLKAMSATSGPGISLYSEHISFAIASEIPIVIVDVQRLGPSTGSATRGADSDIQFLRWGSSGGLPVIVLSPVNAADCFFLTVQAFNLAETYRCPVFLASNKEVALTKESVDLDIFKNLPVKNRAAPLQIQKTPFLPFSVPIGKTVPDFLPIGGKIPVRQTSSTHGPDGYITTDSDQISNSQKRLKNKFSVDDFIFYDEYLSKSKNSDILIITYGVSARAARAVCRKNPEISLLVLKTLWPVPEKFIRQKTEKFKKILVIEMNLGQYVREIERIICTKPVKFLGQMNGRLIRPSQIMEALCSI